VSVYFDTNVLVALFSDDALSGRADRIVGALGATVIVSDFAAAEFSAVIAIRTRSRDLSSSEAHTAFSNFDAWCARDTQRLEIESKDVQTATMFIRRLDLAIRTPDAVHMALALRAQAELLTFDKTMAAAARVLGLRVLAT
jgi:predicted nucleic acid-binding protein